MTREAPQRPPWSWPGAVALVLAGALGGGWCVALVVSAIASQPPSDTGINMLGGLGQTLAGAVAAYLGYQIGTGSSARRGTDQAEPTPPGDDVSEG